MVAGAKATAASTHGPPLLNVIGTVVAEPAPIWDSAHPLTELQAPTRVYPEPAVYAVDAVSVAPTIIELRDGAKDETDELVWNEDELPVEDSTPVVVAPLNS